VRDLHNHVRALIGHPGCGKTREISQRVARILADGDGFSDPPWPFIICSLTRAAAAEAAGRVLAVPKRAIGTLHSHCFRALEHPTLVVAPKVLARWNEQFPRYRLSTSTARASRFDDVGDTIRSGASRGDRLLAELDQMRHRLVPHARWPATVRQFEERWSEWKRADGLLDFTDLIERADSLPESPEWIFTDEAQDLSRLEVECLLRLREAANAELVLVGDMRQSIYEWRGACPTLFEDLRLPPERIESLTQSYRIPEAVHAAASRWVRRLSVGAPSEYLPRRVDPSDATSEFVAGSVVRCGATWKCPERAVREAVALADAGKSVLIIGSTNRFLGPTCAVLRRMYVPFSNPWRRKERVWNPLFLGDESSIAHPLIALIDPVTDADRRDGWWGYDELAPWIAPLRSKGLLRRGARARIQEAARDLKNRRVPHAELEDWFEPDALDELIGLFEKERETTPVDLARWWLGWARPQRRRAAAYAVGVLQHRGLGALRSFPRLHPSTAHAAKGAEADHVFIFPDLSPAGMRSWTGRPSERDSVIRLFYVAMTRPRETLHLCEPASPSFVGLAR